jgi:hypothetical protein
MFFHYFIIFFVLRDFSVKYHTFRIIYRFLYFGPGESFSFYLSSIQLIFAEVSNLAEGDRLASAFSYN